MKLTDTHSHVYDEAFECDRAEVIARALKAGVNRMLLPSIDSGSHEALLKVCREYPDICLPMMGLHPTSVNDNPAWQEELSMVEKHLASHPGVRLYAIGEVGLDLHWSKDFVTEQMEVFERQIELSIEYNLPLVIHTRDAWPEMITTLGKFRSCGIRGVMHSFSGSIADYRTILEIGDFAFGIGGPVTYKKSLSSEVVAAMNPEHILLETDCPYLPPTPFRGKRNESSYLTYICNKIAEIRRVTPEEIAEVTTANAKRVFGL